MRGSWPIAQINVNWALYDAQRERYAFYVKFGDGTGAWSHSAGNLDAIIKQHCESRQRQPMVIYHGQARERYNAMTAAVQRAVSEQALEPAS